MSGTSDPFGGMPDWKSPFRPAAPQTSTGEYTAVRDQLGSALHRSLEMQSGSSVGYFRADETSEIEVLDVVSAR